MKNDEKRRLVYYFPELKNNSDLPVNFAFSQFYTLDIREDDELLEDDEQLFAIPVKAYQTSQFQIFGTAGKPISKIIR